jgi:hypothetical protein
LNLLLVLPISSLLHSQLVILSLRSLQVPDVLNVYLLGIYTCEIHTIHICNHTIHGDDKWINSLSTWHLYLWNPYYTYMQPYNTWRWQMNQQKNQGKDPQNSRYLGRSKWVVLDNIMCA